MLLGATLTRTSNGMPPSQNVQVSLCVLEKEFGYVSRDQLWPQISYAASASGAQATAASQRRQIFSSKISFIYKQVGDALNAQSDRCNCAAANLRLRARPEQVQRTLLSLGLAGRLCASLRRRLGQREPNWQKRKRTGGRFKPTKLSVV